MDRIVAIDFETANSRPNSACQIGLVVMEGFEIVAERSWLIRPPRLFFAPQCVKVHGLTARDCMDKPAWDAIWPDVREMIDKSVLLGHNVGFDARVLVETCKHYELPIPPLEIQCSRLLAKRVWPSLDGHGLANVAKHLRLEFQHHDALEDARASARIACLAKEKTRSNSLLELEESTGLLRGAIRVDRVLHPRTIRLHRTDAEIEAPARVQSKVYRTDGIPSAGSQAVRRAKYLAQTILDRAASLQPLAGKQVVLVGSLLGLERNDAIRFLETLGRPSPRAIELQNPVRHFWCPIDSRGDSLSVRRRGIMGRCGRTCGRIGADHRRDRKKAWFGPNDCQPVPAPIAGPYPLCG